MNSSSPDRRRMIQYASAAVLVAVVVVVALIVASQSGDDSDSGGGDGATVEGASEVAAELEGIPQDGTVLGEPTATARVIEYGDLQCPVCAEFSEQVVPAVIDGPVRDGEAQFELRQWAILGEDSTAAAKAALAAAEQDRYWEFVELFYRNQGTENSGYVDDDFLESIADAAGVDDLEQWNSDREDPALDAVLSRIDADALDLGFDGTPSLLVQGPQKQEFFDGIPSAAAIEDAIAKVGE